MGQCEATTSPEMTPSRQIRCILEAGHDPVYIRDQLVGHNYGGLGPYSPRWEPEQIAAAEQALTQIGVQAVELMRVLQSIIPVFRQMWDTILPSLQKIEAELRALEAQHADAEVPPDHVQ